MNTNPLSSDAETISAPGALPRTPISQMKLPYRLSFVQEATRYFSGFMMLLGGDYAAYYATHISEFFPTAMSMPFGPIRTLERDLKPYIGRTTFTTGSGRQTVSLDEYVNNGKQRVQALMIIHRGRVVYEAYPGIDPGHTHLWGSVAETLGGLLAASLESDGTLDTSMPVSAYVDDLQGTPWDQVSVLSVLNMATNLTIPKTEDFQDDPASVLSRMSDADSGMSNYKGEHETIVDVLREVRRLPEKSEQGLARYDSIAAQVLGMVIERASGRSLTSLIEERVWSRIGARAPLMCALSPQGDALAHRFVSSTMEDLARYALLYTASRDVVANRPVVTVDMLDRIRNSGSKMAYRKGDLARLRWVTESFGSMGMPVRNSWQWDAVFADGAMFKHDNMSQGLYVHPEKDFVGVYFSTCPSYLEPDILPGYLRQVGKVMTDRRIVISSQSRRDALMSAA